MSDDPTKDLKDRRVRSWRTLLETSRAIYRYLDGELQKLGSNVSRFQILFFLYFEGAHSASELAKKLDVSRGNMSTFTKRLMDDGLIAPDDELSKKNRPFFVLTKEGEDNFQELLSKHLQNVKAVAPCLSDDEMQKLIEAKGSVQDN